MSESSGLDPNCNGLSQSVPSTSSLQLAAEILAASDKGGSMPHCRLEGFLRGEIEEQDGTDALLDSMLRQWKAVLSLVKANHQGRVSYREFNQALKEYAMCQFPMKREFAVKDVRRAVYQTLVSMRGKEKEHGLPEHSAQAHLSRRLFESLTGGDRIENDQFVSQCRGVPLLESRVASLAQESMDHLRKRAGELQRDLLKSKGERGIGESDKADPGEPQGPCLEDLSADMWLCVREGLDADRDGFITIQDVVNAMAPHIPVIKPDKPEAVLQRFTEAIDLYVLRTGTRVADLYRRWTNDRSVDTNRDGRLSAEELSTILVKLPQIGEPGTKFTQEELDYVLCELDGNRNGTIGFREFNGILGDNRDDFMAVNLRQKDAACRILDAVRAAGELEESPPASLLDFLGGGVDCIKEPGLNLNEFRQQAMRIPQVAEAMGELVALSVAEGARRRKEKDRIESSAYGQDKSWKAPAAEEAEDKTATKRRPEDEDFPVKAELTIDALEREARLDRKRLIALRDDIDEMEVSNEVTKERKNLAIKEADEVEKDLEATRKLLKERKEKDPESVERGLWGSIFVLLQRASNTAEGTCTEKGLTAAISQYGTPRDHTAVFCTILTAVDEELGPLMLLKTLFQNWSYWPEKQEEWGCSAPGGALCFKGFVGAVKSLPHLNADEDESKAYHVSQEELDALSLDDYRAAFNMIDASSSHLIRYK